MTKLFITSPQAARILCLTALLAIPLSPGSSSADTVSTEEWQIEADKVTRYEDPKSVIAEGNVILIKKELAPPTPSATETKDQKWADLLEEPVKPKAKTGADTEKNIPPRYQDKVTIKADWIAYDVERGSIKARGNVSIKSAGEELKAESGSVDLTKETGSFNNATILRDSMSMHLEGKTIEKTGVNTYHIENGWVITCKLENNETPPWSFASTDTSITEGGYAVLKNATFRIKDVPVLYSPWMIVPAKNKRQTGFMLPEVSFSERNGFGANLPLFVNISDSTDITLFPEYYENRGAMPGMEFRYVLNEGQKGTFMGSFLNDNLSSPDEFDYYNDTGFTHTNSDRYWFRGKIDHDLPDNLYTRIDLDVVSDRDYLTEFNSGLTGFTQSNRRFFSMYGRSFQHRTEDQRRNTAKVLKAWDTVSLETNFLAINDTSNSNSSTSLWKLPGMDLTGSHAINNTSLSLDWNADYVNYWVEDDGIGGHRLDLFPRISAPIPLGTYLESRAEAGVRYTAYAVETYGDETWEKDETPSRSLFNLHGEVGSTLLRNFGLGNDWASSWDHRLRPYLEYDFIPETNQDDLPVFDEVDRISDANAFTYGVNNFFELFKDEAHDKRYDFAYFKIWESYDLRSEYSDRPLTPISLKLGLQPVTNFGVSYQTDIGAYGEGVTMYSLEGNYSNSRGDAVGVDYVYTGTQEIKGSTFNRDDLFNTSPFYSSYNGLRNIHQINVGARTQIINTVFAKYQIEHSLSQSETIEQNISLIYQPSCWSIEVRSSYTPTDEGLMLVFNLANIGNPFGINLAEN